MGVEPIKSRPSEDRRFAKNFAYYPTNTGQINKRDCSLFAVM